MIENTLATLGKFLSETFEIDKKQVVFAEKDSILRKLSENNLPLKLPAVSYHTSSINKISLAITHKQLAVIKTTNLNSTLSYFYEIIPVKLDISVGIYADNIKDYFNLSRSYFKLLKLSTLKVELNADSKIDVLLSISDVENLTTPPEGKEKHDFDSGNLYLYEGSFNINSFILYSKEYKLIRELDLDWDVNY